jgi:hypothetical protein
MKRSLAPPRRDKPTGGMGPGNTSTKKLPVKLAEDRGTSNEKAPSLHLEVDSTDKIISQKFE